MSNCGSTHRLQITTLGSNVTRTWIRMADGQVETDAAAIDELESQINNADCNESQVQCWKDRFVEGGLDNTFTRFTHTNQLFTVTFDNGDVDTFIVASATGWTDQVNQMSVGLGGIMPWAVTVDPFCNIQPNGCGGLPAPFVELNKMVARYVGFRVCPGQKVPISVQYTSDQQLKPRELVIQHVETPEVWLDRCLSCEGDNEWKISTTKEPYTPVCAVPCSYVYPELPTTTCSSTSTQGCDDLGDIDPNNDVAITAFIVDCGTDISIEYMVFDVDGALVDYDLVGTFRPGCDPDAVLELPTQGHPTSIVKCYGIDVSSEHIDSNNSTEISFGIGSTGLSGLKWEVSGTGDNALPFTLAIKECIESGNTALINITDPNGVIFQFPADTIGGAGNTDGSGNWYFIGPGAAAGGSGKVKNATLSCGGGSGQAYYCADCENGNGSWRDLETGNTLSVDEVATLKDCKGCEITPYQFTTCASEAITDSNAGVVSIGDGVLFVGEKDCDDIIQSGKQFLLSNQLEIVDGVLTDDCADPLEVETTQECIKDTASVQWVQIKIIDPNNPENPITLYYTVNTSELGIPEGDPSEWSNCSGSINAIVSVKPKCSPTGGEPLADRLFIGDAASGTNHTEWSDAVGAVTMSVAPSPNGTTAIYNGSINGNAYTVEQVDYATLTAPSALTRRNHVIESPVSQGGASLINAGHDNTTGSSLNPNAFLISFTQPIEAWGATFLDTESDNAFANATITLFDAAEIELSSDPIVYPNGEDGGSEAHFIGLTRATADVSYILVATGATASMQNQNSNRLAFGDMRIAQPATSEYTEIVTLVDGELICTVYDSDKNIVTDQTLLAVLEDCPVDNADCWRFAGDCRCYDSNVENCTYINEDNSTDIDFSMNTSTIKWNIQLGQQVEADATGQCIADCIASGSVASIIIIDVDGNTIVFEADTIVQDGTTNSGFWAFTGTGPGGFSGKVRSVTIQCGDSNTGSGKACKEYNCGTSEYRWVNQNGDELTPAQVKSLVECSPEECTEICPICSNENIEIVQCATEANTQVAIGDQIFTVAVRDCNGVIQSSTQYNLSNSNVELTEPVVTESCDPAPDVETIEQCFVDVKGNRWTRILIIDPVDPSMFVEIFYDVNLELGIPDGDPKEWTPCPNDTGVVDRDKSCFEWFGQYYKGWAFTYADGQVQYSLTGQAEDVISGAKPVCCDDCIQVFGCRDGRLAWPLGSVVTMTNGDELDISGLRYSEVAALITNIYGGTYSAPSLGGPQGPNFSQCQGSSRHEIQLYNVPVQVSSIDEMTNFGTFGNCDFTGCLTPDRHCFCVTSKGKVKSQVKRTSKELSKVKTSSTKPGRTLNICRINYLNCDGNIVRTEYEYQGKVLTEEQYIKAGLTEVDCDTPSVTYSPAAVTCATEVVDGTTVALNCQVFTNDNDPTDTFTQYTLADNYVGIGNIGDTYTPTDELTVVPCAPGSITETTECYIAQVDVKGVANAGDSITVVSVTNAVAGTTTYTITHSSSGSEIYVGADPLSDVGIDLNDPATWLLGDCDPEIPVQTFPVIFRGDITCVSVDGNTQYGIPVSINSEVSWFDEELKPLKGDITKLKDCECQSCDECSCPELDQGDSVRFDASGNPLPYPIRFPYTTSPGEIEDFVTAVSVPAVECLTIADPTTLIPVRFYVKDHDLISGNNGSNGFNVNISGTGVLIAESLSNTYDNTTPTNNYGTQLAGVGTTITGTDLSDRWVEFDVPLGELLQGITFITSAVGSVNNPITETIGDLFVYTNFDWSTLNCEGC